jgi:hypothetical protein
MVFPIIMILLGSAASVMLGIQAFNPILDDEISAFLWAVWINLLASIIQLIQCIIAYIFMRYIQADGSIPTTEGTEKTSEQMIPRDVTSEEP